MILDGKKVRSELLKKYKDIIAKEHLNLKLAIIYVGDDKPSDVYVNNKIKYCTKVGIKTELFKMASDVTNIDIINKINELNDNSEITGIIVQSPLPSHLDFNKCISYINENKDIDGLTETNFYKLANNKECLHPCTPKGIMNLLKYYDIDVTGKNVCIVGRGPMVGKTLYYEMLNHDATVFMTHSKTRNLKEITLISDIIVSAVGKKHLITADMVKNNAIIVDAGITIEDGKIYGDVDFDNIQDKCQYVTPNPGGVGPMTIATIIENLIIAGRRQK